jgi:nucleoid DNA-binding protein
MLAVYVEESANAEGYGAVPQDVARSFAPPGVTLAGSFPYTQSKGTVMDETQAKKPMNKTEIVTALAEATALSKQQIAGVFDELAKLIGKNLAEDGAGTFMIPDLMQIKVVRKPAVAEHKGINPFTKEEMIVKAKPAKNVVKLVPLKGLKKLV